MKFIIPNWPVPSHIKAFTTTRQGWGNYTKFGESFHTATSTETKAIVKLLDLPQEPIWLTQNHGTRVVEAIEANRGSLADASFSIEPQRVCVVLTADCLPILLTNQHGTKVAAIHAGWRGLAAGIIEKTLDSLNEPSEAVLAWFGPAIGPNKFEVGADVYRAFTEQQPGAHIAFTLQANQKWLGNLYTLATLRLKARDISAIYGGSHCTFTEENLFFSYRRDQQKTGRMASLIWIDAK